MPNKLSALKCNSNYKNNTSDSYIDIVLKFKKIYKKHA